MRKITLLAVAIFLLIAPAVTNVKANCEVCRFGISGDVFAYTCGSPGNGGWGYEFCEIQRLPKPGYFYYCVQTGNQCLYIEVR